MNAGSDRLGCLLGHVIQTTCWISVCLVPRPAFPVFALEAGMCASSWSVWEMILIQNESQSLILYGMSNDHISYEFINLLLRIHEESHLGTTKHGNTVLVFPPCSESSVIHIYHVRTGRRTRKERFWVERIFQHFVRHLLRQTFYELCSFFDCAYRPSIALFLISFVLFPRSTWPPCFVLLAVLASTLLWHS